MEVDAWLPRAAAARPGRAAVNGLSYTELLAAARAAAGELAASGVAGGGGGGTAPGAGHTPDRVALLLPPGDDFAIALHASMLLGAVAVPVDPRLGERERAAQTAGCAAVVDAPLPRTGPAPAALRATHDLDAVAVVVHTSGSSAAPKPVELTYGNLLWSALGSAAALGSDPYERWLCALPVAHVGGLSILVRSAIAATTAVVHERFETERVHHALMAPDGPTIVSLVPTTLARLLDAGLQRPPRLRCALVGGGPLAAALMARAREAAVPVAQTYGLTEACSQVTTARPGDAQLDAGPPLFCTRLSIDAEGQVLVRSPTVAPRAASPDGWLATGDLGALDPEGRLTIVGRKADTIISGGENVAPAEVEAVLAEHPAVAEAVVYGRPDAEWGEAIVATVVLKPGTGAAEDDLRQHCAARLAPHKVPKSVAFAADLPRTPSGKLIRRSVQDPTSHQIPKEK